MQALAKAYRLLLNHKEEQDALNASEEDVQSEDPTATIGKPADVSESIATD
jgi:hypothetical protein